MDNLSLHPSTFQYHAPTDEQKEQMELARAAAAAYAEALNSILPSGTDKTYVMRNLRSVAMWANVCITRHHDGTPR